MSTDANTGIKCNICMRVFLGTSGKKGLTFVNQHQRDAHKYCEIPGCSKPLFKHRRPGDLHKHRSEEHKIPEPPRQNSDLYYADGTPCCGRKVFATGAYVPPSDGSGSFLPKAMWTSTATAPQQPLPESSNSTQAATSHTGARAASPAILPPASSQASAQPLSTATTPNRKRPVAIPAAASLQTALRSNHSRGVSKVQSKAAKPTASPATVDKFLQASANASTAQPPRRTMPVLPNRAPLPASHSRSGLPRQHDGTAYARTDAGTHRTSQSASAAPIHRLQAGAHPRLSQQPTMGASAALPATFGSRQPSHSGSQHQPVATSGLQQAAVQADINLAGFPYQASLDSLGGPISISYDPTDPSLLFPELFQQGSDDTAYFSGNNAHPDQTPWQSGSGGGYQWGGY